ncbi:MAG: spore germination protein [Oscillospiraceae bacterium]|nr:spore germination protein [Oscillospiraceae bacterium]
MDKIQTEINKNREMFEQAFYVPENKDIVFRDFNFSGKAAFIVYIDGMASQDKISDFILRPLLNMSNSGYNLNNILQISSAETETDSQKAVKALLTGDCVLCVDGDDFVYICETKGFDKRGVDKPQVENSILGAQEAFTENLRTNTALVRRIIKNQGLMSESLTLGRMNNLSCCVMYVNGIANTDTVNEVKRRLNGIETDFIQNGGMVEQFIEDTGFSLFQTILTTERPDNTAALLMQGRIAVIVDGSPRVIIAPVTLFNILKTSEESALRAPYASTVRAIRMLAVFVSLFTPSLYLAATTFHPEMLPASLLVSIAKSRLSIPYPALLELILMEAAFEMIREAGQRIPGAIGGTVGIVGGLILGEAAISAGLVSRGCVVIIALTSLGNFAIPQYQTAFAARMMRIIFLISAGFFGFFGIAAAFVLLVGYLYSLNSIGSDFIGPVFSGSVSMFPRRPVYSHENRPRELNTQRPRSQPEVSRKWKI